MLNDVLNRLKRTTDGMPHLHPHLLRHTCATLLSELGYSDAVIGAILGHSKGRIITRRYTRHRKGEACRRRISGGIPVHPGQRGRERGVNERIAYRTAYRPGDRPWQ